MSKGESLDRKKLDEQSISKFELDISRVDGISLNAPADKDLYGNAEAAPIRNIEEELMDDKRGPVKRPRPGGQADVETALEEMKQTGEAEHMEYFRKSDKGEKDDYGLKHKSRPFSPPRKDAFNQSMSANARSYYDVMAEHNTINARQEVHNKLTRQQEETKRSSEQRKKKKIDDAKTTVMSTASEAESEFEKKEKAEAEAQPVPEPATGRTPRRNRWDYAGESSSYAKGAGGETPTPNRWVEPTPMRGGETPGSTRRGGRSKWDEPPTPGEGLGTVKDSGLMTPTPEMSEQNVLRMQKDMDTPTNKPFTDEDLDKILPSQGYEVVKQPEGYQPVRTHKRPTAAAPPESELQMYYKIPEQTNKKPYDLPQTPSGDPNALPFIKPEDLGYFGTLLHEVDEDKLTPEEQRDRKIMIMMLKVKNGTPPMRKSALRQLTEKAREFGAGPLFNQLLPLLMSPTLEDQERHLLVKVIDRVLYKLDDLVRPFVHKILVVIEPMLIDEDYYARVEGREIISNLAKAAGFATMISTMRPDIDHSDEYVRNVTARALAVVASALGINVMLPFLKAVCQSKKSWQAVHTGVKVVQQIAILMGCAVLPYLKSLVEIVEDGLTDEQQKVRTMTALALAALAESAAPYGMEAFQSVIIPLWDGITMYRGKALAAFLKAIGFIITLMDAKHASYYTKEVMKVLIREFGTQEDETKKIVLKVVKQCICAEGVEADYVRKTIVPEFFKAFWNRRMAYDKKNTKQLVETTVEIACKVGGAEIIKKILDKLKDESEPFRKLTMETIEKVSATLGVADIDPRLEEELIDGILYAFHEQISDDTQTMLNGFGTVVNCLGVRAKPYIPQICGTIQWRLNNRSARIRQQAADLTARIAAVMKNCGEESLLGRLGVILYQYLGEEYPEVLGSILGALKAIANVIGMAKMTPPIKDLLPRLTPILKNRHEKVQENCIDLVGRIADRGSEYVSAREWMRICFDLLDLLNAHKKGIRRAAVNTFGYIAKAIGPQDVLVTLLNNLRVQERQNRVCTTVAIAIVAEICGPFTILPALMNEYRVPELNVQNGVLKSLSFMFEYVGEMGKDYVYAVTPLLEDALMDRDLVHRQTASAAVKHLALGVVGLSCEDALVHLLNFVFPNKFEASPHVINAVLEGIEGIRVAVGPGRILLYLLQGLFHPARKVREMYWKVYNNMYIGAADGVVSAYPNLEDDKENHYRRTEMELFL